VTLGYPEARVTVVVRYVKEEQDGDAADKYQGHGMEEAALWVRAYMKTLCRGIVDHASQVKLWETFHISNRMTRRPVWRSMVPHCPRT